MRKLTVILVASVSFLALPKCSSGSKSKTKINAKLGEWNYDKARETKQAEEAQNASLPAPNLEAEANCSVVTHSEMIRAKLSGCRRLDPRTGSGPDSYCCPRSN
jgi:hypothetical protein